MEPKKEDIKFNMTLTKEEEIRKLKSKVDFLEEEIMDYKTEINRLKREWKLS